MSSEKQMTGWTQITIALIALASAVAVAWISMPVKFQGSVGQGRPDPTPPTPSEVGRSKPPAEALGAVPTPTASTPPPHAPSLPPLAPDKPLPTVVVAPTASSARNPFGVKDVFDVEGADVKAFANKASAAGGTDDPNARPWAGHSVDGTRGSLDGEWASRWKGGTAKQWQMGTATVKETGGRVFILFKDPEPAYLIEAVRQSKTRLVGRYVNLKMPKRDTSPWVGEVVGNERIDGVWDEGRWDLRRKLR
jgi:hypothetical protein